MCGDGHLQFEKRGDVLVVRFLQHQLVGKVVAEVAQELYSVAERQEYAKLLLSLSGVDRLSTEMFAGLIMLNRKMLKKGGKLKLCAPVPYVREVFSQTRLDQVLDIEETEASGLSAFA